MCFSLVLRDKLPYPHPATSANFRSQFVIGTQQGTQSFTLSPISLCINQCFAANSPSLNFIEVTWNQYGIDVFGVWQFIIPRNFSNLRITGIQTFAIAWCLARGMMVIRDRPAASSTFAREQSKCKTKKNRLLMIEEVKWTKALVRWSYGCVF